VEGKEIEMPGPRLVCPQKYFQCHAQDTRVESSMFPQFVRKNFSM
jgi:hypothetical protein